MTNILESRRILSGNIYNGDIGHFGILENGNFVKWYFCREEFAKYGIAQHNGFLFWHSNDLEDIAEFIDAFEALLQAGRHKTIQPSKFQRVQGKNERHVSFVSPGPFWLKQLMRHSLFTILLRAALNYKVGGEFWSALFSYNLSYSTRSAIMRFLDGYTWYKGDNDGKTNGWHNTFCGLEGVLLSDKKWGILIKPKDKKDQVITNGVPVE